MAVVSLLDEAVAVVRFSPPESRCALANALTAQSQFFDRAADGERAFAAAEDAIAIWSDATEEHREKEFSDVAASYEARAEALITVERCTDAIHSLDEAIAIFRRQSDAGNDRTALRQVARLMQRRGLLHAHLGEHDGALASHAEATAILRPLAEEGNGEARNALPVALFRRAESLIMPGEDAAAAASADEALAIAKNTNDRVLAEVLELDVQRLRRAGGIEAAADRLVEAASALSRCLEAGESDALIELLAMTADTVGDLADAGHAEAAAALLDAALAHGAPDGRHAPDEFASVVNTCRQMTDAQLRNTYARMTDGGAALRIILGRERR